MSQVDWNSCPEGTMFYSAFCFRKHVDDKEYYWEEYNDKWDETGYEPIEVHRAEYPDFEMRPSLDINWFVSPERMDEILSEAMDKANNTPVDGLLDLMRNNVKKSGAIKSSVDFLEEVKSIQSQRAAEYEQDGGERSFDKIATVFNTYTGKNLQPSDVALILEILKNVRFYAQDGYHSDSVVDKISYSSLWAELVTKERT